MKTLTDVELAYIAGFFDGEGSLTIHENGKPSPRGISPNHTLQVSICNTDPLIIMWLHSFFGGALSYRKPKKASWRNIAQWTLRAASTLPFLETIQPFVRMKSEQVEIGIEFQRAKSMRGPKKVSLEEVQWRESQRQKIRALNHKEHIK